MGSCNAKEKLNDDLDQIKQARDAETILLKIINGPDGELDAKARLSGTLQEFIEKEVAPELGVPKECAKHLEAHLSGYQLKPNTKIIRDFTELCSVRTAVQLQGLTDGACLLACRSLRLNYTESRKLKPRRPMMQIMKQQAAEV